MALVPIAHPLLPGQTGHIDETALPELVAKGWRRGDVEAPADPEPAPASATPEIEGQE